MSGLNRRDFLKLGLSVATASPLLAGGVALGKVTGQGIPTRTLGGTGEEVSVFGLGGGVKQFRDDRRDEAVVLLNRALDLGINYFDTAASYGPSEEYFGVVVPKRRKEMFLATKTTRRTRDGAWRDLERSLKRLGTDYLDLWQMHGVAVPERDTTVAFGRNGAIRALEEAKAQKLVRFGGVTGHHRTDVLAEWLRRYPFETLLAVVNACDVHHADSFIKKLLPVAQERGVAVIAMKVPAYGKVLNPSAGIGMREAMYYALSQPGVANCIIASDSLAMLEQNVALAKRFRPLSKTQLAQIETRTASYWQEAVFYREWS